MAEICLGCSAAGRDAQDLLEMAVYDQDYSAAAELVDGMDVDRARRVLLVLSGLTGALLIAYVEKTQLSEQEVLDVMRQETGVLGHEHRS